MEVNGNQVGRHMSEIMSVLSPSALNYMYGAEGTMEIQPAPSLVFIAR